ncbi:acrosin-like [Cuculus canorus]|uniref:acrosin-like n=1 Tax=Cuculus canorus TaxID=55661 RepID=UPI0023AAE775|nr:acrosin-like [Cuculus canorus]
MGPETQHSYVRQIIIHDDYDTTTQAKDIALMELHEPLQCTPYVQLACVPDFSLQLRQLRNCYVGGWGVTTARSGGLPPSLQEAKVPLIDLQVCNSSGWYHGDIHPHNLCAGYPQGGIDTCQGDSGGPLVCQDPHADHFWLVGVTSFGVGCARARRPGIYASTQYFRQWILTQMAMPSSEAAAATAESHFSTELNPIEALQPVPIRPLAGDSVGPLVCQDPHADHFWLVGVTSFGVGCARARQPGVYASTQYFRQWILIQMAMPSSEAWHSRLCQSPSAGGIHLHTHFQNWMLTQITRHSVRAANETEHAWSHIPTPSNSVEAPQTTEPSYFSSCLKALNKLLDFFTQLQEFLRVLKGGST